MNKISEATLDIYLEREGITQQKQKTVSATHRNEKYTVYFDCERVGCLFGVKDATHLNPNDSIVIQHSNSSQSKAIITQVDYAKNTFKAASYKVNGFPTNGNDYEKIDFMVISSI